MQEKRDNYAVSADNARLLFLKEDQEKLIKKFNLKTDNKFLYLRFLDLTYRIERESGKLQMSCDGASFSDEPDYNAALSIFDYLCWSRDDRRLSGQWVSLQSLGYSFHSSSLEGKDGWFSKWENIFSGSLEKLEGALKALNGEKMPGGDVGYVLSLFDELPIYLQFWDCDEEFPPKLFFLWDSNTLQYIHYETTFYVLNMLLDRIGELFDSL